jgi:hypothetical protein
MEIEFKNWLLSEEDNTIEWRELIRRFEACGWRGEKGLHGYKLLAPDGKGSVNLNIHNWVTAKRHPLDDTKKSAIDKVNKIGYPCLDFLFRNPFKIPAGFDQKTQTIIGHSCIQNQHSEFKGRPVDIIKTVAVHELVSGAIDVNGLTGKQVEIYKDVWKKVELAALSEFGGIELMFDDETTKQFPIYANKNPVEIKYKD